VRVAGDWVPEAGREKPYKVQKRSAKGVIKAGGPAVLHRRLGSTHEWTRRRRRARRCRKFSRTGLRESSPATRRPRTTRRW
jgi:hypothetical protein